MPSVAKPLPVVFTDLDGTFLDHHSYSYQAALPAVQRLKALGGLLYAVSSKTLAEQLELFAGQAIFDGYVAENGGVISLGGELNVLGPAYAQIQKAKHAIEQRWGRDIPSFQLRYLNQVIESTGLSEQQARLACQRLCSDPLIFTDEPKPTDVDYAAFAKLAECFGTKIVQGGRFATICGNYNKADALLDIVQRLGGLGIGVTTLALGDSYNDLDMLQAADMGVWVPNSAGNGLSDGLLDEELTGLMKAPDEGPVGWATAVNHWLDGI